MNHPIRNDAEPEDLTSVTDIVERAIRDIAAGRIVVVADDERRENEGDLICAARYATPDNIAFMASQGRGLICMPMSQDIAERLTLPPMYASNEDNHGTAFTVSIDHIATSTGISAHDRSTTALACIDPDSTPDDFRRPGHLFPLVARPGGVLERGGHTEATVDLARMAGLEPCGLCCEMMNEDGTMMRRADLRSFAAEHGLTYITIDQLREYRRMHDAAPTTHRTVRRVSVVDLPSRHGRFVMAGYASADGGEHVALIMGDDLIASMRGTGHPNGGPVLCRAHSQCLTGDVFGSMRCDCGPQLDQSMRLIAERGRGVVLYLSQEGRGIGLLNKLRAYELQEHGMDTLDANLALGLPADAREYDTAAAMLRDLGIDSIELMTNNPDKIDRLTAAGITVADRVPVVVEPNEFNTGYLSAKRRRMGHLLDV